MARRRGGHGGDEGDQPDQGEQADPHVYQEETYADREDWKSTNHGPVSGDNGKTSNPIKRFFTTFSRGIADERVGYPHYRRPTTAKAMTGFLAHYANNLSHFSHEAEFFTVSSSAEDDEFYIFAHDESDMVKTTSVGPYLSVFRRVLASGKPMQDQMAKLGKTLESLRQSYGVSSPAAKNIEDFLARLEKLMERESKRIAEASEKGAVEEASAIKKLAEALKEAEESELSSLIKETDQFLKTAEIPLEMHERLKKAAAELKELKTLMGGFLVSIGMFFRGYGFSSPSVIPPSPVDSPPTPSLAPRPFLKLGAGPTPFHFIGKRAKEVLFGDYEETPFHGIGKAGFLICDKQLGVGVELKSDPSVETTLCYGKEYLDYKMEAKAKVVLPFGDTSKAEIDVIHRRACLSASVGLSANPVFNMSGMFGIADGICGGARLSFESCGLVREFELGLLMDTTEFGSLSTRLNREKLQVMFDTAVGRATGAAELTYFHDPVAEKRSVCLTGGLSYNYDNTLTLKGRFSSDLHVGGMIQFEERLASIVLRATGDVDLRAMGQQPRVGFQVVFDPTWK
ncbi:uncharacterized protein LOC119355952 isoform X1 [Triticum dicoccoides]|uniref:uncharacterized protein LOC119355952 isoform X1 n=2 Tax=Triticum dicoccoides TaxID=85692 RepID=UPI00188FB4A8|nr:uncharacterized protein LOC119355952 isoform X1 [Triticum dicoccoides]